LLVAFALRHDAIVEGDAGGAATQFTHHKRCGRLLRHIASLAVSPRPMVTAVTTTSGNIVFSGELTGDFIVLDAVSGDVLYRFNTGGSMGVRPTLGLLGRQEPRRTDSVSVFAAVSAFPFLVLILERDTVNRCIEREANRKNRVVVACMKVSRRDSIAHRGQSYNFRGSGHGEQTSTLKKRRRHVRKVKAIAYTAHRPEILRVLLVDLDFSTDFLHVDIHHARFNVVQIGTYHL
jgi:hypothetical protein